MKFDESKILEYACDYPNKYDEPISDMLNRAKDQGYLTIDDLVKLVEWKIPKPFVARAVKLTKSNHRESVIDITRTALSLDTEDSNRIPTLKCLNGVGPPVASAILHWFHECNYPIWDKHARNAVCFNHNYTPTRWRDYTLRFRTILERQGVDKRTLDRALWVCGKYY